MKYISIFLDIILLLGGFLSIYYQRMMGGGIGKNSMTLMIVGFFLLGAAHILETLSSFFLAGFGTSEEVIDIVEFSHRIIVVLAFGFILVGYARLAKFARS